MSRCGIYDEKLGFLPEDDFLKEAKPLTNYDRLVSKSPEELAEWLDDICKSAYDEGYTKETGEPLMSLYPSTASEWTEWLKQEVKT